MAKRTFSVPTFTPTAQADGGALISATYMALIPNGATQSINIMEILEEGQATSSAVNIMMLARSSSLGITPTALAAPASDGPLSGATAPLAAPPITYTAAATGPVRSAATSTARLMLGFNAFGGIVRWLAAPGEEWQMVGNAVNVSESTLSAFTGGNVGAMSVSIVYEPL